MIIRQASHRDSVGIQSLLTQLGYSPSDEAFILRKIESHSAEDYHLLVCDIDHETVGFISLHWFDIFHSPGKMGRITAFCVSDHMRGQGVGRTLIDAAEKFLARKGCSNIEVTCNFKRTRTHAFYVKNGYTEESRRFNKSLSLEGPGEDFIKNLSPLP
jgi:GNAT superfamily N-acetyltransferase